MRPHEDAWFGDESSGGEVSGLAAAGAERLGGLGETEVVAGDPDAVGETIGEVLGFGAIRVI